MVCIHGDNRFPSALEYIGTAVSETPKEMKLFTPNTPKLHNAICDVIINDCKSHYISTQIQTNFCDPVTKTAFITALCAFDHDTDKIIASNILRITPTFLLGSFYDFCLPSLKSRWDEVCILANENSKFLLCRRNFDKLLHFLISNIESRVDHVFVTDNGVLDYNRTPINVYVNNSLTQTEQIVQQLVFLSPRKIFFCNCQDAILEQKIRSIFNNCLPRPRLTAKI